jgi:hypothetical protein
MVLAVCVVIQFENSWNRGLRLCGLLQMFSACLTHFRCQVQHRTECLGNVCMKQQTFSILSQVSEHSTQRRATVCSAHQTLRSRGNVQNCGWLPSTSKRKYKFLLHCTTKMSCLSASSSHTAAFSSNLSCETPHLHLQKISLQYFEFN